MDSFAEMEPSVRRAVLRTVLENQQRHAAKGRKLTPTEFDKALQNAYKRFRGQRTASEACEAATEATVAQRTLRLL